MTARVIIHADDFGLHPALNAGIERAHREGVVSSASLMPTGAAFDNALARLRALPTLDLGLHFALVGVPGYPPDLSAFFYQYARRRLSASAIGEAFREQRDALRPLPLSHFDSHQHLHALPAVMRVVCPLAAASGLVAVRLPLDGPALAPVPPARRAQAALLRAMARLSRRYIAASGLHTSDHFSGMAVSGHLTASTLAAYIQTAKSGLTEIVCHPGADNAALRQTFAWGYDWEGELAALTSSDVRNALAARRATLVGWGD